MSDHLKKMFEDSGGQALVEAIHERKAAADDKWRARTTALADIVAERVQQDIKWGEQNHPNGTGPEQRFIDGRTYADLADHAKGTTDVNARYETLTYKDVFLEEVFEAMAEEDPAKLRTELIQCAAVAVAWVEKIDRDEKATEATR